MVVPWVLLVEAHKIVVEAHKSQSCDMMAYDDDDDDDLPLANI